MEKITQVQARLLMLASQGLLTPPSRPASKTEVLECIRRMGALQIDTIHVVARSPYLVLWSRLGDYSPAWLDELLAEGKLFEHWAHAACAIPIEDFPYFRRRMLDELSGWREAKSWLEEHAEVSGMVLERIRREGPLKSVDFESPQKPAGGWWNWKEEKLALECLHTAGVLMTQRRENFQRVYNLRERVLPDWDDARTPDRDEMRRVFILRTVRAMGVATLAWIPDYYRLHKNGTADQVRKSTDEGDLIQAEVEGWEEPVYLHHENIPLLKVVQNGNLTPTLTTLLSPFDPLVWDRNRARALFNFDYSIECYLPQPKREYGYFSLPILRRGALVGRADAKAHRKQGIFEVKALYLESGVNASDELAADLAGAIQSCARWHNTPTVKVSRCDPPGFSQLLQTHLAA